MCRFRRLLTRRHTLCKKHVQQLEKAFQQSTFMYLFLNLDMLSVLLQEHQNLYLLDLKMRNRNGLYYERKIWSCWYPAVIYEISIYVYIMYARVSLFVCKEKIV